MRTPYPPSPRPKGPAASSASHPSGHPNPSTPARARHAKTAEPSLPSLVPTTDPSDQESKPETLFATPFPPGKKKKAIHEALETVSALANGASGDGSEWLQRLFVAALRSGAVGGTNLTSEPEEEKDGA